MKIDLKLNLKNIFQFIASTEKLKFLDESTSVQAEADRLKSQGVNVIIVLSHCGLDIDKIIAQNAGPDIDIIVGGHTHTFMYTGPSPGPDIAEDTYPAIITQNNGHKVLIVQASAYTKYVGDLTVYFDKDGEAVDWKGQPMFLDTNVISGKILIIIIWLYKYHLPFKIRIFYLKWILGSR